MVPEPLSIEAPHGAALEYLILKCLAKTADDRWQSCRDVATELEWLRDSSGAQAPRMFSAVAPSMGGKSRERLLWAALAVSFVLAVVFGTLVLQQQIPETRAVRFLVAPPESTTLSGSFVVSPNGAELAFVATTDDGVSSLYVRALDSLIARRLPGTEGARHPFWSPDNRFIAFFAEGKLKKIRSEGGPPQSLATVFDARGGTWNRDGAIVFAPNVGDRLYRINEDGTNLSPVTTLDHSREESSHQWPRFLPDGRHFLFLVWSAQSEARGVYIASLGPDRERLVSADWGAIHAKGLRGNDFLLFLRGGSLMGQAFDTQKLSLSGEPFPLAEDVWFDQTAPGLSSFSSSENDVLAYRTGGIRTTQLTWFDSKGNSLGNIGEQGAFRDPALSPDGRRIVVARIDDETGTQDLWLFDPSRDVASRFTFHPANEVIPIWSPDGGQIVFSSDRSGVPDLYQKTSSGTAPEQLVIESNVSKYATDWTRDGRYVIYANWDAETSWNLWTLRVEDKEAVAYLRSGFDEFQAQFSPDGRFVAYSSNESGRYEVYVQRFPMSSGKWQISTNGGSQPQWRSDGEVLFYLAPDLRLTGVELNPSASGIDPSLPEALFPLKVTGLVDARNHFAVGEDGERFLVSTLLEKPGSSNMAVVLNWSTQLEQ